MTPEQEKKFTRLIENYAEEYCREVRFTRSSTNLIVDYVKSLMPKWRPISEAPTNGKYVIISGGIYGCEFLPGEFHGQPFKKSTLAYYDEDSKTWLSGDNYHHPEFFMELPPAP